MIASDQIKQINKCRYKYLKCYNANVINMGKYDVIDENIGNYDVRPERIILNLYDGELAKLISNMYHLDKTYEAKGVLDAVGSFDRSEGEYEFNMPVCNLSMGIVTMVFNHTADTMSVLTDLDKLDLYANILTHRLGAWRYKL